MATTSRLVTKHDAMLCDTYEKYDHYKNACHSENHEPCEACRLETL